MSTHPHSHLLSRRLPVLPVLHRFLLCHGQLPVQVMICVKLSKEVYAPCAQLFDAGEGGDKGVGMGAADRDSKKLASEHIGGAVETTCVEIPELRRKGAFAAPHCLFDLALTLELLTPDNSLPPFNGPALTVTLALHCFHNTWNIWVDLH